MDIALDKLIVVLLVVYTITLHELGHAVTANWAGDPTPGRHGRLTLNPLVQLDPIYSVVLPLITYALNGWPLGWAYCPIDPSRFRRPLRDRALVALAGPAVNLSIAALCVSLLWLPFIAPPDRHSWNESILFGVALWNLLLGLFNLLPLPGLDGYDILRVALPLSIRQPLDQFRRMGYLPLMVAIFIGSKIFWKLASPALVFFLNLLPEHMDGVEKLYYWMNWN
ncbi:MAG: site-2 protease family protein [Planctomycetota bacterium]|nr:site-2 protease family protein [Planctomycetota bacterium]